MKIQKKIVVPLTLAAIGLTLAISSVEALPKHRLDIPNSVGRRVPARKPAFTTVSAGVNISHVVVKFTDESEVRLQGNRFISLQAVDVTTAQTILDPYINRGLRRLFENVTVAQLDTEKSKLESSSRQQLADLNGYFRIDLTDPDQAESVINKLNALDVIEIAYVQPVPEVAGDISPATPDWEANQDYREAAPAGVDADYANSLLGGDGSGVRIIDIEHNWRTTHEDLDKAIGGIIGGVPPATINSNHGTAVIGEIIAGDNGYGVTGISPGADINMISVSFRSTSEAIYLATENLEPGDIILIELHSPGPRYDFQSVSGQLGYVCMEYWQAIFDAIQYAWAKGIIVVEAAGNGSEDFDDDSVYENRFDTTYRNSHAILAGAGFPYSSASNLEAFSWSNHGERVNLQGYGSGVYTTGYGDLFAPSGDTNQYYTASFSGTSSASPIVVGAIACLQGYYKANFGTFLTSDQVRDVLTSTGTPQLGDLSVLIGPRPDLAAAIPAVPPPADLYVNPVMAKAVLDEGESSLSEIWLINRSLVSAYEFQIEARDLEAPAIPVDWLTALPSSGIVAAADSILLSLTIDASNLTGQIAAYKAAAGIIYGSGGELGSEMQIPVFLNVRCNDQTYAPVSSSDESGPDFSWVSARDRGTRIGVSSFYANGGGLDPLDDGSAGPFPIGFDFNFFGEVYTEYYVGMNGGISFTDPHVNDGGYYSNFPIPGTPFTTIVAPFWNDLIWPGESGGAESGIYQFTSPSGDSTIIEWYQLSNFNNSGDNTTDFALILLKFGKIVFQYANVGVSSLENTAVIGVASNECQASSYFSSGLPVEHIVGNNEAIHFPRTDGTALQAGDVDANGVVNISDISYLVNFLFGQPLGPTPPVLAQGNATCDERGDVNISDVTYLVQFLFGVPLGPNPCIFWHSF